MRSVLAALAFVACAAVVQAQPFMTQALTSTTCPGSGCMVVQVDGQGSVGIQILGTFVGTLQFQQSIDSADASYVTLSMVPNGGGAAVTSATAPGFWTAPIAGARYVRVKMSAYTSGTASVGTVNTVAKVLGPTTTLSTGLFADGSAGAPTVAFAAHPNYGMWSNGGAGQINFSVAGAQVAAFATDNIYFPATNLYLGPLLDVVLSRDAANVLACRNGTNPCTARIYGTFTDASNNEYMAMRGSGSTFDIFTTFNGTGVARALRFGVAGALNWAIDTSGNFADQGTHTITAGSSIKSTGATAGVGYATGAGAAVTQITSRATGVTLNNVTGDITLFSAAGSATAASFTVTNSAVAANDNIIINQKSGTNLYNAIVTTISAGSFVVTFFTTGGVAVDAPVFHFSIVKGANS